MHLINVETLRLEEFTSEQDQDYVILSHRWQEDEVLYDDMQDLAACTKAGKRKLIRFCTLVKNLGMKYAWVDTCCIDKKSSAALSEAINSMYKYYSQAQECIAYLYDVQADGIEEKEFTPQFEDSVWFTRCWTLQELIAPSSVKFYNSQWRYLSDKAELASIISHVTSIEQGALTGNPLSDYSVAKRMSWACDRHATRTEDIAYGLMGIFDVNMPMLYGEGEKAFKRLQEEIIRYSTDETIFAWEDRMYSDIKGPLAPSPHAFRNSGQLEVTELHKRGSGYNMTNRGLVMEVQMAKTETKHIAFLNASYLGNTVDEDEDKDECLSEIFVGLQLTPSGENSFKRSESLWRGSLKQVLALKLKSVQITIQNEDGPERRRFKRLHGFSFGSAWKAAPSGNTSLYLPASRYVGYGSLKASDQGLILSNSGGQAGQYCVMKLLNCDSAISYVKLGVSWDYQPVCIIVYCRDHHYLLHRGYDISDEQVPYTRLEPWSQNIMGNTYLVSDTYLVIPPSEADHGVLAIKGFEAQLTIFRGPTWDDKREAWDFEHLITMSLELTTERFSKIWEFRMGGFQIKEGTDVGNKPGKASKLPYLTRIKKMIKS